MQLDIQVNIIINKIIYLYRRFGFTFTTDLTHLHFTINVPLKAYSEAGLMEGVSCFITSKIPSMKILFSLQLPLLRPFLPISFSDITSRTSYYSTKTNFMKRVCLLLTWTLIFVMAANAQSPQALPFQGVARDSNGTLLASQAIGLRITIHEGSPTGSTDYQERDSVVTNNLGLFTLAIGQGTVLSGTFSSINWSSGTKYVQVELDPTGGTSYSNMGTSQLQSVPFALYALNSASIAQPSSQVAYGAGSSITSDAGFTRTTSASHVTKIKSTTGAYYYSLGLGDSLTAESTGYSLTFPSCNMVYGDTQNNFQMIMGMGNLPTAGVTELGYLNLSDSAGNSASIDFGNIGSNGPSVLMSASSASQPTAGGGINLLSKELDLFWRHDNLHQDTVYLENWISIDSTGIRLGHIVNNTTTYLRWPISVGSSGQVLTTDGSNTLSWASLSGSSWGLTGNSGTTVATNFIGTTDSTNLEGKANNSLAFYIGLGNKNSLFGSRAGYSVSTGGNNTGTGYHALYSTTTGNSNSASGLYALYSNTTGYNNVAVGDSALLTNTTGNSNTGIGYHADVNAGTYNNSTALGANSTVTASNQIVFGNSVTKWLVNGIGWVMPAGQGAASSVLTNDGSGNLSWGNGSKPVVMDSVATGTVTITLANNSTCIVKATGTIPSVTLSFPAGVNNDEITIIFEVEVTTLTTGGTGNSTVVLPATRKGTSRTFKNLNGRWY